MKKVLHITNGLHRCGVQSFIMNILRHIDRSKISFDFLLYEKAVEGYEEEAKALGAKIHYYHPRKKGITKHYKILNDFFKKHASEYAAVHLHGNVLTDALPLKMAQKYGVPVRVVHSHSTVVNGWHNIFLHKYNRKHLHKMATHFLACNEEARVWGFGNSKSFERSRVVPNGIDLNLYKYDIDHRREIREELNIPADSFVLAHTGGFRPVKNHAFIIEIFEKIKAQRPESLLVLCGGGGNENEIKELINNKNLQNSVRLPGMRSDVNKILSAADSYIFPSLYEGLPFALIEAQASGLPVFASDTISPEVKLSDNITLLSLKKSADEWAEIILNYDYSSREAEIGEKLKEYDISHSCEVLTEIYNSKK